MLKKAVWLVMGLVLVMGMVVTAAEESPKDVFLPESKGGLCADFNGDNLVSNPSFEGAYSAYVPPDGHPDCPAGVCNSAQMAPDWTPWWLSHDPADPDWIIVMPEWKPASDAFTNPTRVRTGERAQQLFSFYATHEAGFYQQVLVEPGRDYCFSIWGHGWSAQDDDDAYSGPDDGILQQRIGLDPTGGTDWQSGNIIWGTARTQYDLYGLFEVSATANASTMTLFVYSQPAYAVKHNDVYWDDARLSTQEELVITVDPSQATFVADVDTPQTVSRAIQITANGSLTWNATIEPGGTLTPQLSATSGTTGTDLTITIDSTPYGLGTYTANLTLTTDPPALGSPLTIPLTLIVLPDLQEGYLPIIQD